MAGVLFVVNVPRKEHEKVIKEDFKRTQFILEQEKIKNATQIITELKEKRLTGDSIDSCPKQNKNKVISPRCKSSDSLSIENNVSGLYRTQSENTLDLNGSQSDNFSKKSWENVMTPDMPMRKVSLKRIVKQRKNLFKINRPVRGVDILGEFHLDTPLETILFEVLQRLGIQNAAWNTTRDDKFWQVIFSVESGDVSEELLQVLKTFGIGTHHHSAVSVVPCGLYYTSNDLDIPAPVGEQMISGCEKESNSAWSRFSTSVRARTNLAQVLHDVRANASLTFDWLFLLVVAAFVATIGLIENSTVILVASMLISPLMSPITAATLGTAVKDRSLQRLGLMHEMLGLFLSLVIGFIFGLAICAIDARYGVVDDWPTYEMITRCELRSLWVGVLVAIPSGAGVALAVLGENTASLVGVAISASLLPPAVNAGLLWAMALVRVVIPIEETRWTVVQPADLAILGTASLCLTLVNIVCIFLAGVVVYKVKEVCPLDRKDISWWKINRNHSRASKRLSRRNDSSWNGYSKWCNESDEAKEDIVKNDHTFGSGLVQSDTITYRRNPTVTKRLTAQNIEAYCLRKAQFDEKYTPLNTNNLETKPTQEMDAQREINQQTDNTGIPRFESYNRDSNIYNYVNKNSGMKAEEEQPTLEPSSNFTVDVKNHGVVLGSKTFNV